VKDGNGNITKFYAIVSDTPLESRAYLWAAFVAVSFLSVLGSFAAGGLIRKMPYWD
jgi:hypothetical protein